MRKYIVILLLLIAIGLALTFRLFTQEQKLDQTVFVQTTKSVRNLQILDNQLARLLSDSRFKRDFDHTRLSDTNYQVSEEFDNLRFDALFEEIEGSPELSAAVAQFEEKFVNREEYLDRYIESNEKISQGLSDITSATQAIEKNEIYKNNAALLIALANTNAAVFSIALGNDSSNLLETMWAYENDFEQQFKALLNSPELAPALNQHRKAVAQILENYRESQTLFTQLNELDTGQLLSSIENEYANFHIQAIKASNAFRNALLIYGLLLLVTLFFFGYQIRKNYLSLEQQVSDRTRDIEDAYQELSESQEQLIQSEKMASLGEMVAGVAHEINTPLGYVSSNVETLKTNIKDLSTLIGNTEQLYQKASEKDRKKGEINNILSKLLKTHRRLQGMELIDESTQLIDDGSYGLSEISKLVSSLRDFARLDRQALEEINVTDCIQTTLPIASATIKENNVTVETDFSELPRISCMPSKLNQLVLNIITNACQAMKNSGGVLRISTYSDAESIYLSFQDEGVGMDDETQQKMFDPFFTTKKIGQGTGLGMSIAYKIVKAHNGSIDVESALGKGTKIVISLPI